MLLDQQQQGSSNSFAALALPVSTATNGRTEGLADATPKAVAACAAWVADSVRARGTTDIKAPLQRAMRVLKVCLRCALRGLLRVRVCTRIGSFLVLRCLSF